MTNRPRIRRHADVVEHQSHQDRVVTVQTLRPGVPRASNATFHVRSLEELKKILNP